MSCNVLLHGCTRHTCVTPAERHTILLFPCDYIHPVEFPGRLETWSLVSEHVRRLKIRETVQRVRADRESNRALVTYFDVAYIVIDPKIVSGRQWGHRLPPRFLPFL
jgi:predicted metalloprotease